MMVSKTSQTTWSQEEKRSDKFLSTTHPISLCFNCSLPSLTSPVCLHTSRFDSATIFSYHFSQNFEFGRQVSGLEGNPFCVNNNDSLYCEPESTKDESGNLTKSVPDCAIQSCPLDSFYEYNPASLEKCECGAPIRVGYRLKSPGFSDFFSHTLDFMVYLTSGLDLNLDQLYIDSVRWEEGPRLRMYLKFFPSNSSIFNISEVLRIRSMFTGWQIPESDIFGPYELLNITLLGPYEDLIPVEGTSSKLGKGILAGIILGAIAGSLTCSAVFAILIFRRKSKYHHVVSRKRKLSKVQIKIDGLNEFTLQEICQATNNFSDSMVVGQGGYGMVYKGVLADGTEVAVKRAKEGSLQGSIEFFTEIELLSRLHHRNLVSLIGYCDEDDDQILVYEFMSNGTLRDHLPAKQKEPLNFLMRVRIALGSAKGIHYLHTEVDPPVFHRDIKASNILLDSKFVAKVADFGLSRLVPELDTEGGRGLDHVSTVVKGTPGYLDPEYFLTHKLTDKSDVYSLGIVFLELLTGMLPISHGKNIVREVNIACQSGRTLSVIDKDMGDYPPGCVERFLLLALRCCHDETDARPSVSEIVRELENIRSIYSEDFSTPSVSVAIGDSEVITTSSSVPTRNAYLDFDFIGRSNYSNNDIPSIVAPR